MWTPLDVFDLSYLRMNLRKPPKLLLSVYHVHVCTTQKKKSSLLRCFPFYLWFSSVFALFFCCSASFFFFSKGCVCRAPCAPSQQGLKIHSLHLPCFSQPTHTSLNMSAETRARLPSQKKNYTDDTSTSQIHLPARRKGKRIPSFQCI